MLCAATDSERLVLDHGAGPREEIARRGGQNPAARLRGEPGIAISNDSAAARNPKLRGSEAYIAARLLVGSMRFN